MAKKSTEKRFGARVETVDLSSHFNFPRRLPKDSPLGDLLTVVKAYPFGEQQIRGIPVAMGPKRGPRIVLVEADKSPFAIDVGGNADYICVLHHWHRSAEQRPPDPPVEGLLLGEYEIIYPGQISRSHPIRARFEVSVSRMASPAWLALPVLSPQTVDPVIPTDQMSWGRAQTGLSPSGPIRMPELFICAIQNPEPDRRITAIRIHWRDESSLVLAGLSLFRGAGHPLRELPRRSYRVGGYATPPKVTSARIDMGTIARIEHTQGAPDKEWLKSPYVGLAPGNWIKGGREPEKNGEDLIEIVGAEDATVEVEVEGRLSSLRFSLGEAFHVGESATGKARLEVVGRTRQWVQVRVIDDSTGKPTPVRVHFSGSHGEYLAPYGHHSQPNPNWFEDFGADLVVGGRNFAYVPGEFTTDLPTGDVYLELSKGFEYEPVRRKVRIKRGQKQLDLSITRWKDLRSEGWVTADTHVHFLSPQTAWLEAQCEGVNVVNLLASQWGRLFTNVGDYTGRVGQIEDDTIVYVGTENRNHMLGHMSMLGTEGLPVYPMCGGGPSESWVGDPDYLTLTDWAGMNKERGGVVIRPHFPMCGNTEDPVAIIRGLVDGLELRVGGTFGQDLPDWYAGPGFAVQEWYRYLNCGYRVAAVGGTDKMAATSAVGWLRTYAKIDPNEPFTYESWAAAVRAGRTTTTTGPLMDLQVDGREIGDTIALPAGGGTVEVRAVAQSIAPLGSLEIVCRGTVIAREAPAVGSRELSLAAEIPVEDTCWIAARCAGHRDHPGSYLGAHTSPVYIKCGDTQAFDRAAAQHMLGLVQGGIEYLQELSTAFDDSSRRRMVGIYKETARKLEGRLKTEGGVHHHHGSGRYHVHGHEEHLTNGGR